MASNEQFDRMLAAVAAEEPERLICALALALPDKTPDSWAETFTDMTERIEALYRASS